MASRRLERIMLIGATGVLTVLACFHAFFIQSHNLQRMARAESRLAPVTVREKPLRTQIKRDKMEKPTTGMRPILFVHFHKSGGTSVCDTMRLHQNQVNITNALGKKADEYLVELNNCNTEFAHPHLDDNHFRSVQNCRMLEPYTMDESGTPFRRNNFLSVEIPLHDPLPCPGFRSFAIMRDPFKRCLSHLYFEGIPEVMVLKWISQKTPGSKTSFFMWGYSAINNMVTRQLLGRARYIRPRPIDDNDFEQAKRQIDKFDVFIPLELLRHTKVLSLLNKTVPEFFQGLQKNMWRSNQQPPTNLTYSDHVIQKIREENKYDLMLYDYMLEKLGLASEHPNGVPVTTK